MDIVTFARQHVSQITAIIGVITYGLARKKITIDGIFAGFVVGVIHMIHPWPAFFWLLISFFLFGTIVTKVGHAAKAHLTTSATGGTGGEGARTSAQVLANCGTACVLVLLHAYHLQSTPRSLIELPSQREARLASWQNVLPVGIVAQYAAVTADTFSSELGILSQTQPFLITAPWRQVPKGTNGGVTIDGLLYGALGSMLLTLTAIPGLYLAEPMIILSAQIGAFLTLMGTMGSVIDSLLGAVAQATVVDGTTGRVVEGPGGRRVKVAEGGSRKKVVGWDLLTNNGVNFSMAALTSLLAMGLAWAVGWTLVGK